MSVADFLQTRERFVPVQPSALLDRMLADPRLSDEERHRLRVLFEMIGARFHFEFRHQLQRLKKDYEPFDPDLDTIQTAPLSPEQRESRRADLVQAYRRLLLEANYVEVPRQQIIHCLEMQTHGGLLVRANLDDYRELCLFYRGVHEEERRHARWPFPWPVFRWQFHTHKTLVFRRAAILVRPTGNQEDHVFLKLFKNVLTTDVKMILPRVRIRMRLFDQLKIGSSVAGSLAATLWKLFTAAMLSPWLFLMVLVGFVGAAIKGVSGFIASRTRYMQALSSSLYFQNLANNASALTLLVDTAETEELKEMLLAYFLLYVERDRDYTRESLDRRIEQWLRDEFGVDVDFEIGDAMRKLVEKGMIVQRSEPDGILKVYDLPTALRRLDKVWDDFFKYNGHTPRHRRPPGRRHLASPSPPSHSHHRPVKPRPPVAVYSPPFPIASRRRPLQFQRSSLPFLSVHSVSSVAQFSCQRGHGRRPDPRPDDR